MSLPSGPAGWHPDPTQRYEHRYYNGTQWTADVSVGGRRFVDPAGTPGQPGQSGIPGWSGQAGQPGWSGQPGWAPTTPASRGGRGMAIASFIVAVVSLLTAWVPFIFVLAAAGAITAFIFGIIGVRTAARCEGRGRGFAVTGIVVSVAALALCTVGLLFTRVVLREFGGYIDPGPFSVKIVACDVSGSGVAATGTIVNNDDRVHDYQITVDYTAGGRVLDSDVVRVNNLAAGATVQFESASYVTSPLKIDCNRGDVFGPDPFGR